MMKKRFAPGTANGGAETGEKDVPIDDWGCDVAPANGDGHDDVAVSYGVDDPGNSDPISELARPDSGESVLRVAKVEKFKKC